MPADLHLITIRPFRRRGPSGFLWGVFSSDDPEDSITEDYADTIEEALEDASEAAENYLRKEAP